MRFFEDLLLPLLGHPLAPAIMASSIFMAGLIVGFIWLKRVSVLRSEIHQLLQKLEETEHMDSLEVFRQLGKLVDAEPEPVNRNAALVKVRKLAYKRMPQPELVTGLATEFMLEVHTHQGCHRQGRSLSGGGAKVP